MLAKPAFLIIIFWMLSCGLHVRLSGARNHQPAAITAASSVNRTVLRPCVSGSEIIDRGSVITDSKLARPTWAPRGCISNTYEKDDIQQCLTNTTILGIGDSIGSVLVQDIANHSDLVLKENPYWNHSRFLPAKYTSLHNNQYSVSYGVPGESETLSLSYVWSPTYSKEWEKGEFRGRNITTWTYEGSHHLLRSADVVFLSIAIWEMALFYNSADIFVVTWRERLRELKTRVKPTTKIIILGLHWLHLDIDPVESFSDRCFTGDKSSVFRRALEIIASCEGVQIIPLHQVTRYPPDRFIDAVHMPFSLNIIIADILFSAVCGGLDFTPSDEFSCGVSELGQTFSNWSSVPEAQYGCRSEKKFARWLSMGVIVVGIAALFLMNSFRNRDPDS